LALCAASPGRSLNDIVSPENRDLIQFLDKRPSMPTSPNTIKKLLFEKAAQIEDRLKIELGEQRRFISATLDLWSDKAMLRSYLGATLHYIDGEQLITRCIGVQQLLQAHTAENIKLAFKSKLEIYGLVLDDIYTITTDEGANVVKAFRIEGKFH